jgi:hypothetical protein
MKALLICLGFTSLLLGIPSQAFSADQPPAAVTQQKRMSKWEQIGKHEVKASVQYWGKETFLLIFLSPAADRKPVPYTRLKVSANGPKGRLAVERHYSNQTTLLQSDDSLTGFYKVGTPVQRLAPKDVNEVSVEMEKQTVRLQLHDRDPDSEPAKAGE